MALEAALNAEGAHFHYEEEGDEVEGDAAEVDEYRCPCERSRRSGAGPEE